MTKIKKIRGIEILDSRGNPTIYVSITLSNGIIGSASVPSGASTGEHEAIELRDNDKKRYHGKGVLKAIQNIEGPIFKALEGKEIQDQKGIDQTLIDLDGTENKSTLGANAILGVSLAVAQSIALVQNKPLFETISQPPYSLPIPMMNIINGGAHANNTIDFQEFMIRPVGLSSFHEQIQAGAEIFHTLKKLLSERGFPTTVGDEGGFAPNLASNEEALEYISLSIEKAGYKLGTEITIALDCAASFFYKKPHYVVDKTSRNVDEQIAYLKKLTQSFPIDSIEDGLDENDWEGWQKLTLALGEKIQLVGDDIFVTNPKYLQRGINQKIANAILIKPNQIGTLTETLETISLAKKQGYKAIISHRSGETESTFIADLAVATNAGQIKTGSLSRSERTAKYNRLLSIEKML
jgi:enolase